MRLPLRHARARTRVAALATILLLALGCTATTSLTANAVPISGAIKSITATPAIVGYGGNVRMTIDFCVPNGTQQGDTFSSTIPQQLVGDGAPDTFPLNDASGNLVATAVKSGVAPNFVYTFTMTAYAQDHNNVCGVAYYQTAIAGGLAGQDIPLTSTTNDGTAFVTTVHENAAPPIDRTTPKKVGSFPAGAGQCMTTVTGCILWAVQSPSGPATSGTLADTLGAGQVFECGSASVVIGTPTSTFPFITGATPYSGGTVTACGGATFTYTYGAIPAGQIVQVSLLVDATAVDPDGDHVYSNSVHATVIAPDGSTLSTDDQAAIHSATAGGHGAGDGISIVKYLTAQGPTAGNYNTAPGFEHAVGTSVPVSMTVTNTGTTPLQNVTVTDATSAGPALTGLVCTFPGGSTGTIWSGPFAPGASFPCTGTIPASAPGVQETDTATVTAVGNGTPTASDSFNSHIAALPAPVSVGDYVWLDANHDGVQDAGEAGVPNVTLTLTDQAGHPVTDINGAAVGPTTTDAQGKYLFSNLPAGTYTVTIDYGTVPADYIPTVTGSGDIATDSSTDFATSVTLAAGDQDLTLDFGLWTDSLPTLAIGDGDGSGLAFTGGGVSWQVLVGATGLLSLGLGITLLVRRGRRRA